MNICLISGTLPDIKCGVGDYTYKLCSELKKRKAELYIVTSQNPVLKKIEGIIVSPVIKKWSLPDLILLLKAVKETDPDLVHIQYPTQTYKNKMMINIFPLAFKLMFRRIPLIVTLHDVKTAHVLNKLRLICFLLCAEKIIVTTREEKDYLDKRFPFLKAKFRVIPIGSNITIHEVTREERDKIRLGLGIGKDDFLISHFGFMLKKKGLEIIFYTLRRLLDEGHRLKLIMISSFYPEKDSYHRRLKNIVERLDLNGSVIWTGYCTPEKVSGYLYSSDICVQIYEDGVSFRRGSFVAVLSHGLPIISTSVDGLPSGLTDHDNLLAISPGDIDGLVKTVKELMMYPDLRKRLGASIKLLSRYFSWQNIADEHIILYQEAVKFKK